MPLEHGPQQYPVTNTSQSSTHPMPLKIVGLCGSLRARSYNLAALKAAGELMPEGMSLTIASIAGIPIYNADDQANGLPDTVVRLGDALRSADAVLIASPEYNFSIPGGLKNAIDWLSRLPDQPFNEKPVALLGASGGRLGTARMQYDLRKSLQFLNAWVLARPEVFITLAQERFDATGALVDAETRKMIADQMAALRAWTLRTRPTEAALR